MSKNLDVTISLLSAVSTATSRVTSPRHADLYLQHMQAYLTGLKDLFPDFKFVPNHHMALHLRIISPLRLYILGGIPFERLIGHSNASQQIIEKQALVKQIYVTDFYRRVRRDYCS